MPWRLLSEVLSADPVLPEPTEPDAEPVPPVDGDADGEDDVPGDVLDAVPEGEVAVADEPDGDAVADELVSLRPAWTEPLPVADEPVVPEDSEPEAPAPAAPLVPGDALADIFAS